MTVSNLSFGVIILCLVGGFTLSFLKISTSAQRRIYWTLACTAGVSGIFLKYPSWDDAVALGLFPLVTMAFIAYVATPYIKIRGRIYALTITDPDPEDAPATTDSTQPEIDLHPDSYSGLLTATTMWWLFLIPSVIATGHVYLIIIGKGESWAAIMSVTFLALLIAGTAYGDASWQYPIARGQYVQFVVNTVITAGVFYFLYVAAYYAGRRHPIRREQSMEYRVHPRHRDLDS